MRITNLLGVGAACLLTASAFAQPPGDDSSNRPTGDPAMKQKLLDAFDANHDGQIDQAERRAIRRALFENFGGPPEGRGPEARRRPEPSDRPSTDRGPDGPREGRRRPDGPGPRERGPGGPPQPGRPAGPPAGPNPERLFNVFDENADGSLSKDEFLKLSDFMRSLRHQGPPWMRRDGRPEFDRPPRGDFQRRGRGDRGPRGEGRPRPPRGPDGPPGPPPPPGDVPPPDDDGSI